MAMTTEFEDYFSQGCGRCERIATADCPSYAQPELLLSVRVFGGDC